MSASVWAIKLFNLICICKYLNVKNSGLVNQSENNVIIEVEMNIDWQFKKKTAYKRQ